MTHLLATCEVEGTTSWSAVPWINPLADSWMDAFNASSWCYECTRGKLVKTHFERGLKTTSTPSLEIWVLIIDFTLWYVWKARCLKVFQDLIRPPRGIDHGYMVRDYQLPTRAIGRGLRHSTT